MPPSPPESTALPTRQGLCECKIINYAKLHNLASWKDIIPTQQSKPDELDHPIHKVTQHLKSLISRESSIFDEPNTLKDAKKSPEWPEWEKAITSELQMLQEKGTWTLEPLPPDCQAVSNRWTFKKKFDADGNLL